MKEPDKIKAEPKKSSLQNAGTSRGNCKTSEFGKQFPVIHPEACRTLFPFVHYFATRETRRRQNALIFPVRKIFFPS